MPFEDYTEFIEPLELPIRGKLYRVPAMTLDAGLRLKPFLEGKIPEGITDEELARLTLGDTYDVMVADNVPAAAVQRAMLTALAEYESGRTAAEILWRTGGDPKAIESEVRKVTNRAQRRLKSTGAVNGTK